MKLRHDLAALLPRLPDGDVPQFCAFYEKYAAHLPAIASGLYDRLDAADQARFLVWFLKRWARIDLVNPVERHLYDTTIERLRSEPRAPVPLGDKTYRLRDLRSQGHDFKMLGYDWWLGAHDILYDQYQKGDVRLRPDDVIIDGGAFIGDTAVYFHHLLGGRCQIHSFELLDENLALLVHNLERNGVRDEQVVLNKLALAERSGDEISVATGATQGSTSMFGAASGSDRVQTISLDDYVMHLGLSRVDFIKMDIEGAETQALAGARHTIQHFKPRLAICLYHRWNDVFTVPQAIHATGVDYRFAFKWVQLRNGWEAILLATPATPEAGATAGSGAGPGARALPDPGGVSDAPGDALADALAVLSRTCSRQAARLESLRRAGPAAARDARAAGPSEGATGAGNEAAADSGADADGIAVDASAAAALSA